ncbi:Photosystem II PsbI - like 1 [Theobroma cacao]|nr:Photosystem II PsbI - like 1 [Theobroma cacao]
MFLHQSSHQSKPRSAVFVFAIIFFDLIPIFGFLSNERGRNEKRGEVEEIQVQVRPSKCLTCKKRMGSSAGTTTARFTPLFQRMGKE